MPLKFLIVVLTALLVLACGSGLTKGPPAYFEKRESAASGLHYFLYLPPDYPAKPRQIWPMILFLHGADERGFNLEMVRRAGGLPSQLTDGLVLPFIVVMPQCPFRKNFSDPDMVEKLAALVEELKSTIRIDPARTTLTGFSLGGNGAWSLAVAKPGLFTRLAPVGSIGLADFSAIPRIVALPIWIFQGEQDKVFPPDRVKQSWEALQAAGSPAKLTIWPGADHGTSAEKTYSFPDFYAWAAEPASTK